MAKKIFEFRPHTRSFIDKTSGTVPINTSVVFMRLEKGYSAHFSSTADLDTFGVVTGVKTAVMVLKPTTNTKLLQDNGTDKIEITGGNISGAGLTECTVNNVNTDAVANNVWSLVIAEFSAGISFSTDLEIDVTADIDIVSIVCYDEILSGLQKGNLWDEYNHLRVTSSPTTINHRIPVSGDEDGCVLAYNLQDWRGGTVFDLSSSGHNGTPVGCVQPTVDGAGFDGSTGYIDCGTGGGITGNLTIEALVRKSDVSGQEAIINKGTANLLEINYYLGFANDELRYIITDGVSGQEVITTTFNMLANNWYYIVLTVDGSFIKSYANGSEVLQTAQTVTPTSNTKQLFVGALHVIALVTFPFDGNIKFTKVHNYALTPEEIKNKYNKIAQMVDLQVMKNNLLPDERTYTAGMVIEC